MRGWRGAAVIVCMSVLAGPSVRVAAQSPQVVSLDDAVATALDRHPSITAAARAVDAAQARLAQARAGPALQVSLTGRASVGTLGPTGAPTGGDPAASHSVAVDTSIQLLDSGVQAAQVAQAEAAVDAARAALEATRQDIALAAAQAYFQVLRAMRVVEVRDVALGTTRRQVEQAEALVRAGTAAPADVIKAQAAAAGAEADLVTARSSVELSLASLRNAMGLPITQAITVSEPQDVAAPELTPADAAAEAVRGRPEVRKASAELRSTEAALRIAEIRAGLAVSVAATGSFQVSPNPGQAGWSVSATMSFPIADGGRSKAAVDEAKANLAAARARAEATTQQVQLQAFQAALTLVETRARLLAVRAAGAAAEESLRVAEGRYRAGVAILLEVLDGQVAATQARVSFVQTESDLRLAAVALRHALGRPILQSAQSAQSTQSTQSPKP